MFGCAALQAGHSRSPNSTMVMGASCEPWTGPETPFSASRVSANGSAPKGTRSPVNANFWSGVMYILVACCPLGVLKTTVACVIPEASDGLISAIFQLRSWFHPNIAFRKELRVASLGPEPLLLDVDD